MTPETYENVVFLNTTIHNIEKLPALRGLQSKPTSHTTQMHCSPEGDLTWTLRGRVGLRATLCSPQHHRN